MKSPGAVSTRNKNRFPKSKLLRRKESLVRMDVFVHEPRVLEAVRQAVEEGLTPTSFSIHADVVVLRLDREEA
jgi:hypothetical protein